MKILRIFLTLVLFFGMAAAPIGCGGGDTEKKPAVEEGAEGSMEKAKEGAEKTVEGAEEAVEGSTEE